MKKIFSLILALGTLALASCNMEEAAFSTDGKTPLEAPANYECEAGLSSATIAWTQVENAGQYYYEVRNSLQIIVKKGETTTPAVTVGGLRHSSTYTVNVKAIPSADVVAKYCASEYLKFEFSTEVKPVRNWVWSQPATVYFGDDKSFLSKDAVFGLEEGTGKYVVEAWCGVEGFDIEFSLENQNTGDANYGERVESNNGTGWAMFPIQSGSHFKEIAGWELRVYHGLGGTAQDYVSWDNAAYANGCFYKTNNENGGTAYQWCNDPNGNWTYWQLEYGDGLGDAEPEVEEPWTPDPDATEDWDAMGEVAFGEEIVYASICYSAEEQSYYVENWLGAEDADLVFSRDAETGKWVIDIENSSSFAADCPKDGGHGFYGANGVYWLFEEESESGLQGTAEEGVIWISLVDPYGEQFEYVLSWPASMFAWTIEGNYYCAKDGSNVPASLSYNANNNTYMLTMPPYSAEMTFTINEDGGVVPMTKGGVNVSDADRSWIDFEVDGVADYIWIYVPFCKANLDAGNVTLCISHPDGYDKFTWNAPQAEDFAGTYSQYTEGWQVVNGAWAWMTWDNDVTIVAEEDGTLTVHGLVGCDEGLVMTFDALNNVRIARGQSFQGGAYYVCSYTGADDDIIGTYDSDFTINLNNWTIRDTENSYLYWDNMPTTLTKK